MANKVEDLLRVIDQELSDTNADCPYVHKRMIALIAAARAEGAEQERGRIRKLASLTDEGFPELYLISPAAFAPKESEQDNTTEEEYEDMRRNGGPEAKP